MAGPTGIEPAAYGLRGENLRFPRFPSEKELDLESFKEYLRRNHCPKTIRDILYYVHKHGSCLVRSDFSELNRLTISNRRHCLAALSNLAKFQGRYEDFRRLVKDYGLKWENMKAEDLLISRINKFEKCGSVLTWRDTVKKEWPCFSSFMDFLVSTGLRMVEAVESYNLIIDLSNEGKLSEYYSAEKEILEHFRFKEKFIRNNKKAFVSFVPRKLIEEVARSKRITIDSITNKIKRKGMRPRFNDIREYYATYMKVSGPSRD